MNAALASPWPRARVVQVTVWLAVLAAAVIVIANRPAPSTSVEATKPANGQPVTRSDNSNAIRLLWIVEGIHPVVFGATTDCIAAGPTCGSDPMLDTDTTALRTASLSAALARAITPGTDGYVGNPGPELAELTTRTVTATAALADHLRRWLDSGCGSNIGGLPVETRPAECPDWTATVQEDLTTVAELLNRWPSP